MVVKWSDFWGFHLLKIEKEEEEEEKIILFL